MSHDTCSKQPKGIERNDLLRHFLGHCLCFGFWGIASEYFKNVITKKGLE